jgi:hypothetical protein
MKKLLLLLLFTVTANAQFQTTYPPLNQCDDNNDQIAVFDLTQLIPEILVAVNPNDYTVFFYETVADAQNGANPITDPSNYMNLQPGVQTIYIGIVNNTTSEASFASVNISVFPGPIANPATLTFCDLAELPIYNLNDAINQIVMGSAGLTVTFYETLLSAETGSAPILGGGYVPLVNPGTQILYARVENPATGCFTVTTLTLNTQNCAENCQAPTNLIATSITNTSVTFGWTSPGTSSFWEVLILPAGSPTPTSSNNGIFTQTNPFTFTGLNPQTCYMFYVRAVCSNTVNGTWSSALDFCTYDCTNNGLCPESLTLVSFLDTNNNGVKDVGENGVNLGNFEYEINNSGTTLFGYPDDGVFYIFDTNPTNSYDLAFTVNPNYAAYFSSPTTYTNVILPTGSGSSTYYFPVTQLQTLNDLEVLITPNGNPRPGFAYGNTISFKNKGTETVSSGTIAFTKSPVVSIVSISQTGTITTSSGFDYTFSNLAPNEQRYIYVQMQVPTIPTVSLGDIITNSITIEPLTGDAFPANNNASLSQAIIGSYDPNDKAEAHGGKIVFDDFTANDYLYYTIQFENTGTANAEFIRVEDALHADLDENTFEMLNASHPVNTRREGSQLTWHFFDINLPPSSININDGHGFVHFRIKPKASYAIGDIIPNTASIFFDYNPAIVTNTFDTEFIEFLGTSDFENTDIVLYPNPTTNHVAVSLINTTRSINKIVLYNLLGKVVKTVPIQPNENVTLDISNLSKGVYLVEINSENNLKTVKKLVIQ